jgi:hypothetical protein
MSTTSPGRAAASALFAAAQDKLAILAAIDPVLLDVSLREPCFDSYLGHTLQNKIDLLPLVDGFGIRDKVIATLDYQFEDFPQVEDDFCLYLNKIGYDLTGCFALTAVGQIVDNSFVPDHSMLKLRDYKIPNTMNEIYLLPETTPRQQVLDTLSASVDWLRQNISGDHGGPCRIYMNVVDLIDTFFADQDWACQVLEHLATLPVDALSFEDARGTYFPFQVGATVAAAKGLLRPDQKVLFHCHAGNGMDNASVIEGLLQGADGYWAGMDRESSTIGHAAVSELIANLMRANNPNMTERYQVKTLLPVTHQMHRINTEQETPKTWPIQGANAYRQMLSGFDQTATRAMDLPPDAIGDQYTFRISPVGSDVPVVQGRVLEQLGLTITDAVATQMILLMRDDLRRGIRIRYDDHDPLQSLYQRAVGLP